MSWQLLKKSSNKALTRKLKAYALAYRKLPWMLGDAINQSEDTRSSSCLEELRFSAAQLYDFARVADIWKPEERMNYDLPWTYFRDAGSEKDIAKPLLRMALERGWSRETLRGAVRATKEGVALYE